MDWLSTKRFILWLGIQYLGLHQRLYEPAVRGEFIIQGLPKKKYVQLGDINFGALFRITRPDTVHLCTDIPYAPEFVRYTDILRYAVDRINREIPLPHNLTLGFVVLDDCGRKDGAVAQTMPFVPQTVCPVKKNDTGRTIREKHTGHIMKERETFQTHYDVVAVIGSTFSDQSIAVANVLGPTRVPQISIFSTTDQLSSNDLYPYFMRVMPPDRFQVQVIVSILKMYNWTYVSVLYKDDSYGLNGFDRLTHLFDANDICMAAVQSLPLNMSVKEAGAIAKYLVKYHGNAHVVVVYTNGEHAREVIAATRKLVPAGTFVWIAGEGWSSYIHRMSDMGDFLLGTFLIKVQASYTSDFDNWFVKLDPDKTSNPWFHDYWEMVFNCSVEKGTCDTTLTANDSKLLRDSSYEFTGHIIDTAFMIANATSRVLRSSDCKGLMRTAARACVTGLRMLRELKATQQNGYSGWLEVDFNGDRHGRYEIKQLRRGFSQTYTEVTIAEFDSLTGHLTRVNNASWADHRFLKGFNHPVSQCSFPCDPHEERIQKDTCCWTCNPCAKNERLINNGIQCDRCPELTWPDPETANTTCVPIPPNTMRFSSVAGVVQTNLALLCLLVCFFVLLFFVRHRERRVIKASSKELSYLMLLAITIGYIAVITFMAPPSDFTCMINFVLFCASFTLMYGSLLIRTLRIYRVFEEGKRSTRRPRLTNPSHQIFFSLFILFVQMVICTVVMVDHPKWHKLSQISPLEAYVEHTCDLPTPGLMYFLVYNMLLVAVCTLLAFKTRQLPDNFNESRFIAICVSSTLVISICFIPTYLVASHPLTKITTLTMVLGLNHSVALSFLFLPKVYAVVYQQDHSHARRRFIPASGSSSSRPQFRRHRVATTDTSFRRQTSHLQQTQRTELRTHYLSQEPKIGL